MTRSESRAGAILLVAGFVLVALNLRPAIAGVSPVLGEIMAEFGLTPAAGGAITTVMVVCFGVLAPVAPVLAARAGLDRTVAGGLFLLAAGVAGRGLDGVAALYLGSVVAGTAIAILNVVMPGVVKQHFPARIGLFTGLYVSGLVIGAAAASGLMVPLERATGYGWRGAMTLLAIPALAAALLWLPQARHAPARDVGGSHRPYRALLRLPMTWYVTLYMGLQSIIFYVTLAWLPTVFTDAGLPADQAGYLLGLSNLTQVVTTLTVPIHAGRARTQTPHIVISTLLTAAGLAGVWLAPVTLPWLWMVVLGLGQGASIALALLIITLRAPNPASVTALSAVAQACGYLLAAFGPMLIGLLHQVSGDWNMPMVVLLFLCGVQIAFGALAGRPSVR